MDSRKQISVRGQAAEQGGGQHVSDL